MGGTAVTDTPTEKNSLGPDAAGDTMGDATQPKWAPFQEDADVDPAPNPDDRGNESSRRLPRGQVLREDEAAPLVESFEAAIRSQTGASEVQVRFADPTLPSERAVVEAIRELGATPVLVDIQNGRGVEGYNVPGRPDVVIIDRNNIGRYAVAIAMHEFAGHALRMLDPATWETLLAKLEEVAPADTKRMESAYRKRAKAAGFSKKKIEAIKYDEEAQEDLAKLLTNRLATCG